VPNFHLLGDHRPVNPRLLGVRRPKTVQMGQAFRAASLELAELEGPKGNHLEEAAQRSLDRWSWPGSEKNYFGKVRGKGPQAESLRPTGLELGSQPSENTERVFDVTLEDPGRGRFRDWAITDRQQERSI
jgi:hypothetical protein